MTLWSSNTVFKNVNNQKYFLNSKSAYLNYFWRSCDTEDWSNDAENTFDNIFKLKTAIINKSNISQYYCFNVFFYLKKCSLGEQ